MRPSSRPTSPQWPFWLLLAAWVCANSPQAATYAVLTWLAEARTFSHQQRLTVHVAHLLAGEKVAAIAVRAQPAEPPPARPPVPAEAVLKKFPLSVERTVGVLPPALRAAEAIEWARALPESFRAPPPHEPPRVTLA